MDALVDKKCMPVSPGTPPLSQEQIVQFLGVLDENWHLRDKQILERSYPFPDFASALAFVNKVGELADTEGHHPDIVLRWGEAKISLWTHSIDGLSESDFILAAKIDQQCL